MQVPDTGSQRACSQRQRSRQSTPHLPSAHAAAAFNITSIIRQPEKQKHAVKYGRMMQDSRATNDIITALWRSSTIVIISRRYASAEYVVVVCLSLCHKAALYQNDRKNWVVLAWRLLRAAIVTVLWGNAGTSKTEVIPSGILSETPKNFTSANRCVNETRRRSSSLTTVAAVDASWARG